MIKTRIRPGALGLSSQIHLPSRASNVDATLDKLMLTHSVIAVLTSSELSVVTREQLGEPQTVSTVLVQTPEVRPSILGF